MLIDQMREQKISKTFPNGFRYQEDGLAPVADRISRAQHYLLTESALAMAASVAFSKPSSILAALPWVKLPFESVFIEFANDQLSKASAAAGSPNLRPPDTKTRLIRTGFLLSSEDNCLTIDYVAAQEDRGGQAVVDLSPVQGSYRLSSEELVTIPIGLGGSVDLVGRRGKARAQFKLLTTDPKEFASERNLRSRFEWVPHPDMMRLFENYPQDELADTWQKQADEMYRLFNLAILPAIILLNARNAVEVEHIPAPEKLNKSRAKKGKHPIAERNEIRINLSRGKRSPSEGPDRATTRPTAASLVSGHFKVRSGGKIFWWSPHVRHGTLADVASPKARIVTA